PGLQNHHPGQLPNQLIVFGYTKAMARFKHYTQLLFFDSLAILCFIGVILLGWLPGPGGIPLFILGLSLLAINHRWAKKYIQLLQQYADRISDVIFTPPRRLFFDAVAGLFLLASVGLLLDHSSVYVISAGIFCLFMGLLCFFGN